MRIGFSLALLLMFSVAGCGTSQFGSPQATIQTAKTAIEQHKYREFVQCLSPKARDDLAAGLVMFGGVATLKAQASAADDAEAERVKERASKVAAVCEKHGVEPTPPKINFASLFNFDAEAKKKEWAKRLEPIQDRIAFIADFLEAIRQTSDQPEDDVIGPDATVRDLKTNGDTASAVFEHTRHGEKLTSQIVLKKINGEWKIDELPRLM